MQQYVGYRGTAEATICRAPDHHCHRNNSQQPPVGSADVTSISSCIALQDKSSDPPGGLFKSGMDEKRIEACHRPSRNREGFAEQVRLLLAVVVADEATEM